MAWAEQQRSGRWSGKYRVGGKTRSVGTFTRKAEAERAAAVKEDQARRDPQAVDPRDGRMTWGRWREQWQPRRAVEPTTKAADTSFINHRLVPRWGDVPLATIRREDVQDWVLELQGELGAWSVHHCYRLLSNSLTAAVIEKRITASPCVKITLPPVFDGDERFLTHAEVSAVAGVLDEPYRTLVLTLAGTGLRWGEMAALHWSRVDLPGATIEVFDAWDGVKREVKPYPKSRKRRHVYLPGWVVAELEEHRHRFPPAGRCASRHRPGSKCRSGLVFASPSGEAINYHHFRLSHWGQAVGRTEWVLADGRRYAKRNTADKRAARGEAPRQEWAPGLARVEGVPVEHATIHALRHTCASWAIQQGATLYEVSRMLGHSSIKVTERYAHLAETNQQRLRAALAWPGVAESAPHRPRAAGDDLPG